MIGRSPSTRTHVSMSGRKLAPHHEYMKRLITMSIEKFLIRQVLDGSKAYCFGMCASQMKNAGASSRDRRNGARKPAVFQPYDAPSVRPRVRSMMADNMRNAPGISSCLNLSVFLQMAVLGSGIQNRQPIATGRIRIATYVWDQHHTATTNDEYQ